jgi:excisionase family DNA binding protein
MDTNQEHSSALLTEREAAEFLHVTARGLINWRNSGRVPHLRFGRTVRYRRESLIAMLERMEKGGI